MKDVFVDRSCSLNEKKEQHIEYRFLWEKRSLGRSRCRQKNVMNIDI
jgi:hypothetical protein